MMTARCAFASGEPLTARGFDVVLAESIAEATAIVKSNPPAFAVLDMRLGDGNAALDIVVLLHEHRPDCRMVMLTGYGNLATAVAAVKGGAVDYLAKPADADDVTNSLLAPCDEKPCPPENPMSADRVRWEHIQRVYELCDKNVSETARRLSMHRRTSAANFGQTRPALMRSILFVCLGNICRSPTAEAVFRQAQQVAAGLDLHIDSAGTGGWHKGEPPDERAMEAGIRRGYSFAGQESRKIIKNDFTIFDLVLAMDDANVRGLKPVCVPECSPQDKTVFGLCAAGGYARSTGPLLWRAWRI